MEIIGELTLDCRSKLFESNSKIPDLDNRNIQIKSYIRPPYKAAIYPRSQRGGQEIGQYLHVQKWQH
jgi:hypothetical protein